MGNSELEQSISLNCKVANNKGLHARAAAQVVTLSSHYSSKITISHGTKSAPSLSLIKLLTLDAPMGSLLKVEAKGDDAKSAVKEIAELIESGFGE